MIKKIFVNKRTKSTKKMNKLTRVLFLFLFVQQINCQNNSNAIKKSKRQCYVQLPLNEIPKNTTIQSSRTTSVLVTTTETKTTKHLLLNQSEYTDQLADNNPPQSQVDSFIDTLLRQVSDMPAKPTTSTKKSLPDIIPPGGVQIALANSSNKDLNTENMMSYFNARNLSQAQMGELGKLLVGSCWRDSFGRGGG